MAGKKRAAEDDPAGPTTRSAKVPKSEKAEASTHATRGRRGSKKGPKATMAASQFKARALPLHINITHTPPMLDSTKEGQEGPVSAEHADPGFLGTATLVPSTFATGSYGWKGNKRITIELPNAEGEEGEKEKVHVMVTINATVMGSKGAKMEGGEGEEHAEEHGEEHAEEHAEEPAAEETKEAEAEKPKETEAEAEAAE